MQKTAKEREVRRVLVLTLLGNLLVAAAKVVIGLITRSLAMVSDGIHSSLDATSNVIGLLSTAVAARPPDATHPYGHRRFETLASMFVGGLLLLTGWEIARGSVARLRGNITPEITTLNFVVMIVTIVINLVVSTYERRVGKRLNSEFLLADAEHTRSDVFVSLTVIASLVAVQMGWAWVDAVAALGVVGLIGLAAWRIVSRSVNVLVDGAALEPIDVQRVVGELPGIQRVARVRSRGPADDIHLDLDVEVSAPTTTEQGAAIANEIRRRLRAQIDGLSDIQVYFLPQQDGPPDYAQIARAEGDALGLGVHEVIPTNIPDGLSLDMHVEVPPEQTVAEAHDVVSQFEERLHERIPELARVVTHMEPAHTCEDALHDDHAHTIGHRAMTHARLAYPEGDWHDLEIRREADGGYALSLHALVPPDMLVEDAHRMAESVETRVRAALPEVHRVTIHTEPPED